MFRRLADHMALDPEDPAIASHMEAWKGFICMGGAASDPWKPYLKHPYTALRDLGFPPEVQAFPADQANMLLAQIAMAAINSGKSAEEVAATMTYLTPKSRARRTEKPPPDN